MKKNQQIPFFIAKIRETKKSLRKKKKYFSYNSIASKINKNAKKNDEKIINKNPSKLYLFLLDSRYIEFEDSFEAQIVIPIVFSIEHSNSITHKTISKIISACINNENNEITIDFTKCERTDEATIFFLNIVLLELKDYFDEINSRVTLKNKKLQIDFRKSLNSKVNTILFLYRNINEFNLEEYDLEKDDFPFKQLGYLKGTKSKKHYLENKKGVFTTKIANYLDECLQINGFCFSSIGKNEIEGIISEILNNAEDHSPLNTYYVTSTFSLNNLNSDREEDVIGVLNINFLNFGYSFYDGLEENKILNGELYEYLEEMFNKFNYYPFTKESIFTLYALQEGISRLKFEDQSRGTGTIKFINSFLRLGDYENKDKDIHPHLKIFTGHTMLICDNIYKPYKKDSKYYLSLNPQNDLSHAPDFDNLKSLEKKFPGTMLSVKIFLNEAHLNNKIKKIEDAD